jgi:hydroxymethylbilane synthase
VTVGTARAVLRIGTRTSRLARWQSGRIAELLREADPTVRCEEVSIQTEGDRRLDQELPAIGGKGVFTAAIERALLAGEIDLAVHSLKDLPTDQQVDLTLGAICLRSDPRDVLIARGARTVATLPRGARVGTSSPRRSAQLLARRPDLSVVPLRGNVDTRVRRVTEGEYDAIVLAAAGILRLGLDAMVTTYLSPDEMLPAPGQGALAVQCRTGDLATRARLARVDSAVVRAAVTAERHFLRGLGGGCAAPVGALAIERPDAADRLQLRGRALTRDGQRVIDVVGEASSNAAEALGLALARDACAQGALELMA